MVGVELVEVSKRYGAEVAADRVTLSIRPGELFSLLGPSGCGKTTLLRIVAGFVEADSGSVSFAPADGGPARPVDGVPPHRRGAAMVFQNYALWPHMTVAKNVAFGLEMRRLPRAEVRRRVAAALEMVEMSDAAAKRPNELSGGQQQRVALARALVVEPELVLLDEPLSNLDAKLRQGMRSEIKRIHGATGVTMIYVTHDQKEALTLASRIAVMNRGRALEVGEPRELYSRPRTRFAAGFLGEANFFSGTVAGGAEAGRLALTTAFGRVEGRSVVPLAAGTEVEWIVRPEALAIGPPGARTNSVEAVVRDVQFAGEITEVRLALGGKVAAKALAGSDARAGALKPGDKVTAAFDADDVAILDPSASA
jgi:ABC-type Fe3+/spermidine/putrescine transport system ATPase subunit